MQTPLVHGGLSSITLNEIILVKPCSPWADTCAVVSFAHQFVIPPKHAHSGLDGSTLNFSMPTDSCLCYTQVYDLYGACTACQKPSQSAVGTFQR